MKTVKEAKKSTTKIIKKTVKPVYKVTLDPNMQLTPNELKREFIYAKAKAKVPVTTAELKFIEDNIQYETEEAVLQANMITAGIIGVINDMVEIAKREVKKKKTPWYKKLWHFITFRGWK